MKKIVTLITCLFLAAFSSQTFAHRLQGEASYYADFHHGKLTANGEIFNMHGYTAAHRTLPLGTKIKVTNLKNGKSIILRVNDRGPYAKGRVLDVSKGAAIKLGMIKSGTAPVLVEVQPM